MSFRRRPSVEEVVVLAVAVVVLTALWVATTTVAQCALSVVK
jgi:hypothetical protein